MSSRHLMQPGGPHHPYPPQSYPPGQYPQAQQYRPPLQQSTGPNQGYIMSRPMTHPAPSPYPPGHPNHGVGTVHHTSMPPPPQNYPTPQMNSSLGHLQQPKQAISSSVYPPASTMSQPPMISHPLPTNDYSSSMSVSNKPFVQQQSLATPSSASLPGSSPFPSLPPSVSSFAGSTTPNSAFENSTPAPYSQTTSTTTFSVAGTTPPQAYPHPSYDSYRHPAPAYPASNR